MLHAEPEISAVARLSCF